MSGFFEDYFEPKLDKFVANISWLPELKEKHERQLGANHIGLMAWTTLLWVAIAYLTDCKWINIVAILNYSQVIIAEWPPKGRRIDWITRSAGWIIGGVPAIIALIIK